MDKRKLIIESQYFPCVAWLTIAQKVGTVWLDHAENYNKRSFRNKTWLTQSENQVTLSIPLKKGKHGRQSIESVEVSYAENWQVNHIRAIQSVYGKSPYFIHYSDEMFNLINDADHGLIKFTKKLTRRIIELLDLEIQIKEQYDFVKSSDTEYNILRDQLTYTGEFNQMENIIEEGLVKLKGQTHLPFPISSRSSILDLLFHLGPETRLFLNRLA